MITKNNDNENNAEKKLHDIMEEMDLVMKVVLNDTRLHHLAEYEASHGYIKQKVTPEDVQKLFSEFKLLIKRGSFTLKTLEEDVYKRWGIVEDQRNNMSIENMSGDLLSGSKSTQITGFGG